MLKVENDFKTAIEKLHELENCKHCPNNPQAKKPFSEMKNLKLTPLSKKVLSQFNIKEECFVCLSLETFNKLSDEKKLAWLKSHN